jgi:hypothetical protein
MGHSGIVSVLLDMFCLPYLRQTHSADRQAGIRADNSDMEAAIELTHSEPDSTVLPENKEEMLCVWLH